MSNIKELIRAEIERRKKENMYVDLPMSIGRYYEDRELLSFLDTLPDESEQPTMGYDEAYLNEKIAKAQGDAEKALKMQTEQKKFEEKVAKDNLEAQKNYEKAVKNLQKAEENLEKAHKQVEKYN